MKKNHVLFTLLVFFICYSQLLVAQSERYDLSITEIRPSTAEQSIPWVKLSDKNWFTGSPLYSVKDSTSDFAAKAWLAMTDSDLLFHVEVIDDHNINKQTLGDIWKEDGIQIAIDAQGQGAGTMPPATRGMVGDDDCGFGIALTNHGPYGYAWFWADEKYKEVLPREMFTVERSEKKKLTTYFVSVPWEKLHTKPGVFPVFGIAIQINNIEPANKDQKRLFMGRGADGVPGPGLFKKLSPANYPSSLIGSYPLNEVIRNKGDNAALVYSIKSSSDSFVLKAGFKTVQKVFEIKPSSSSGIRQFLVSLKCDDPTVFGKLSSVLVNTRNNSEVEKLDIQVISMQAVVNQFFHRMDSLIAIKDQNPLFVWHLQSVKALALNEWNKTSLLWNSNPRLCEETFNCIKKLDEGFAGESKDWNSYLQNKRSLFISFISKTDGTLQYYQLDLPKNWDINKAYPLLVELHGAGNSHLLNGPASNLGTASTVVDLMGYTSAVPFSQTYGIGYHLAPWGRGNLGYRGIAETDVWEAIADVNARFKIDENRRYLYGFSMGGGGTWTLGLRTPDLWAALGIYAGATRPDNQLPLNFTKNVQNIPVFIECGEKDFLFESYKFMLAELKKNLNVIFNKSVPMMEHKYPDSLQRLGIQWLTQFVRKRPDSIYFVADTKEHTAVWGIKMDRNERISAAPWFSCIIKGNHLSIQSEGTRKITINPGIGGLNLNGDIIVDWNGKIAYTGSTTHEIKLE